MVYWFRLNACRVDGNVWLVACYFLWFGVCALVSFGLVIAFVCCFVLGALRRYLLWV